MAHWLVKSEPTTYSWNDLVREKSTRWDGVRNNAAAMHLKAMHKANEVLFYHSGAEKAVVGIARVIREAYPDPSDPSGRFVAADLEALHPLPQPVTLAQMKAEPALQNMVMLKQSRLSVAPVTDAEWDAIMKLAK